MGIYNLPAFAIISITVLSLVVAVLYLRLKRYECALKEISEFAGTFLAGDSGKLYLSDNRLNNMQRYGSEDINVK